jgi:hypothetical protein
MTPRPTWLLALVPLLAGCGSAAPGTATLLPRPTARPDNRASPEPQPAKIQQVKLSPRLPRLAPDQTHGIWLNDAGTSWLRLEKPRLRIICIDPASGSGRLCHGHYAFARDGSIFGCIHELGRFSHREHQGLCWNNETSLRGLAMHSVALPFHCELCADGDGMKICDFRGSKLEGCDSWHDAAYRKVALARPGHAGTLPPLGNWELRPPETHDRVLLSILPDQIDVSIVEARAGKRSRWHGECAAGPDGLLYGMLETVDRTLGQEQPEALFPAPLFCVRLASLGQQLQVRSLEGLDLDESMRSRLLGEYRRN